MITRYAAKSGFFGLGTSLRTLVFMVFVAAVVGSTILAREVFPEHMVAVYLSLIGVSTTLLLTLRLAPTRIEVGDDAMAVRWLGKTRIVPLALVESVEKSVQIDAVGGRNMHATASHQALEITLESGHVIELRFGAAPEEIADRNRLHARLREVISARQRQGAVDTAFLARGGRDALAWIASLRGAAAKEGGMRVAVVPSDRYFRIIEDPAANAVDRAAAAVAVSTRLTSDERARIRIAASRTVDPELRHALECAIDQAGEDEAVAAALTAVERKVR